MKCDVHGEWDALKEHGSDHYKTGGVEPVDLYLWGGMFRDFALASIIKYAFRSRRESGIAETDLLRNLEKIIDYAAKLKAVVKMKGGADGQKTRACDF